MKKTALSALIGIMFLLIFVNPSVRAELQDGGTVPRWTVDDVFLSDALPFAIGHRGYGDNLGEDPDRPIENTTPSIRRAFREGIQVVEIDVVLTKDKRAVALHDDYLEDFTCVNSLSLYELKNRLKDVSTLRQILQISRTFSYQNNSDRPGGQVIIEIKAPSPLCDPEDITIPDLVEAVSDDIEHTHMLDQVVIESFSPEILAIVRGELPDIPLMLTISILQLLTPEEIEAATGLPVALIDKQAGFGLQWGEIGLFYRLPGYLSILEYITTLMLTDSRSASLDKIILGQMEQQSPGSAPLFVSQLHQAGILALVYTIDTVPEWLFLSSISVDGMFVNDIPLGLSME